MLLIIDNYDSFVYNLARYCTLAGWTTQKIIRNDALTCSDISALAPSAILLSPGPKTPREAGICIDVVTQFGAYIPILGVCLGHQAIGEAYGYKTVIATEPLHGQASFILHDETQIFDDLPSPLAVGRYHSLVINPTYEGDLNVTAYTKKGDIMGVQHKTHPVYGIQFHPESILTDHGLQMIKNFKTIADDWSAA